MSAFFVEGGSGDSPDPGAGAPRLPAHLAKKQEERQEKLRQRQEQRKAEQDERDRVERRKKAERAKAAQESRARRLAGPAAPSVSSSSASSGSSSSSSSSRPRPAGSAGSRAPAGGRVAPSAGGRVAPSAGGRVAPSAGGRAAPSAGGRVSAGGRAGGAPSRPGGPPRTAATAASPSAKVGAKSKCVMEVERLKRQREERRLRQVAEQAEKLEAVKNDRGQLVSLAHQEMVHEYRRTHPIAEGRVEETRASNDRVRVCIRKRPLSRKETEQLRDIDIVTIDMQYAAAVLHEPKQKVDLTPFMTHQHFAFDQVFDETASNTYVFRHTVRPLVDYAFEEAGNAICFAYGQTGSGKTHTMSGPMDPAKQRKSPGIYSQTAKAIFDRIADPNSGARGYRVAVSFFEIYGGKLFDLLNGKRRLKLHEDGNKDMVVVGLHEQPVRGVAELLDVIMRGSEARSTGTTSANDESSRSHAVFRIQLLDRSGGPAGKFTLIDLAGSERGADTSNADRQTRLEGAEINKSLLALKECIRALAHGKRHTPFRGSKLTSVLKDAFVGTQSRMVMIATISPGSSSSEHTLNTLRYAARVKDNRGGRPSAVAQRDMTMRGEEGDDSFEYKDGRQDFGEDEVSDDESPSVGYLDRRGPGGGGGGIGGIGGGGGGRGGGVGDLLEGDESDDGGGNGSFDDINSLAVSLKRTKGVDEAEIKSYRQFQSAVNKIIDEEEELLALHEVQVKQQGDLLEDERDLLEMCNGPDYDVDSYVSVMSNVVAEKLKMLNDYMEKLKRFKRHLEQEEQTSLALSAKGLTSYLAQ